MTLQSVTINEIALTLDEKQTLMAAADILDNIAAACSVEEIEHLRRALKNDKYSYEEPEAYIDFINEENFSLGDTLSGIGSLLEAIASATHLDKD